MIRIGRHKEDEPTQPMEVSLTIRVGKQSETPETPEEPQQMDDTLRQDEYLRDQTEPDKNPRENKPLSPADYYRWLRLRILQQREAARKYGTAGLGLTTSRGPGSSANNGGGVRGAGQGSG
jgi:hypothetical protein